MDIFQYTSVIIKHYSAVFFKKEIWFSLLNVSLITLLDFIQTLL